MKILILSPHTDDAELGAGGTISKIIREGHQIKYIVFSSCSNSIPNNMPKNILKNEFTNVMKEYGIKDYNIMNYDVRTFDRKRQEILEYLVKIRKEYDPDLVLTTSTSDQHQDHKVICQETIRAFKNCASILGYELPWNHLDFRINYLWKITEDDLHKKLNILKNYNSQIKLGRKYFVDNGLIKGLAKVRGIMCNSEYAEAFEVIRWIQN